MKAHYDIAVVGAGPAGGVAAYYAAKAGFSTLLLEEDPVVGVPIQCGEGISRYAFDNLGLIPSGDYISCRVSQIRVIYPNGRCMRLREEGFVLYRDLFDQHLAGRAQDAGAELHTRARVTHYHPERQQLTVQTPRGSHPLSASIVIGADGPRSSIAAWSGLLDKTTWVPGLIKAYEYRLSDCTADGFDMYFDPQLAPEGYAWIFPKTEGMGNVGIASSASDNPARLHRFMQQHRLNGKALKTTAGAIPAHGPLHRSYTDGVLIAGDAAGHTNPIFLGGIHCALLCGRLAGQVAAEALSAEDTSSAFLARYEARWRTLPLADPIMLHAREILYELDTNELNLLGQILNDADVTDMTTRRKLLYVAKALHPVYWPLLRQAGRIWRMTQGFSLTRLWGW